MKWKLRLYRGLQGLGFPKIRGTFLGVPIIRTVVFWGLYWGPPILGNYHIKAAVDCLDVWGMEAPGSTAALVSC